MTIQTINVLVQQLCQQVTIGGNYRPKTCLNRINEIPRSLIFLR
jgi:hypothetical protein